MKFKYTVCSGVSGGFSLLRVRTDVTVPGAEWQRATSSGKKWRNVLIRLKSGAFFSQI